MQVKKIMEKRFMFVHTLEEAEFNRVVLYFLHGIIKRELIITYSLLEEIGIMARFFFPDRLTHLIRLRYVQSIELVLRGPSGRLLP